jgi:beta propeller repeat protein
MRSEILNRWLATGSLCLALAASAAADITIFRVAATGDDEAFPTVSGNTVVWQFYNSRYDDWDIQGADISNPAAPVAFGISDLPGADFYPVIDGNDVVWQHQYRPDSDCDVYGADISKRPSVLKYKISASMDDERMPYVSDGVVVWQHQFTDAPDGDIFGARLTGKDDPPSFPVSAGIDIDELAPCISGNLVVWHQKAADLPQPFVYGADISDPNKPHIFYTTMGLGDHEMPCLSDGWLVARETDDVAPVMVDNLFDPFNPEGISSSGLTACPKIHKHLVVWQDQSNGTWDIRAYNLITHQEFVVTNMRMSDQINPAVYVDTAHQRAIIVWQDGRDGNWDIYAALVTGPEATTESGQ